MQAATPGKHGQPPQHRALHIRQQGEAPVQGGLESLLAGRRRTVATCEQMEAIVEMRRDLFDG